jgi:hypothetical protein
VLALSGQDNEWLNKQALTRFVQINYPSLRVKVIEDPNEQTKFQEGYRIKIVIWKNAMQYAHGSWLLFLDQGVELAHPQVISTLLRVAERTGSQVLLGQTMGYLCMGSFSRYAHYIATLPNVFIHRTVIEDVKVRVGSHSAECDEGALNFFLRHVLLDHIPYSVVADEMFVLNAGFGI